MFFWMFVVDFVNAWVLFVSQHFARFLKVTHKKSFSKCFRSCVSSWRFNLSWFLIVVLHRSFWNAFDGKAAPPLRDVFRKENQNHLMLGR